MMMIIIIIIIYYYIVSAASPFVNYLYGFCNTLSSLADEGKTDGWS